MAISQRHDHGRAPDHHERRFNTPDRHGPPGPTPVAASPHKRRHGPNPKFRVVFTCTRDDDANLNAQHKAAKLPARAGTMPEPHPPDPRTPPRLASPAHVEASPASRALRQNPLLQL